MREALIRTFKNEGRGEMKHPLLKSVIFHVKGINMVLLGLTPMYTRFFDIVDLGGKDLANHGIILFEGAVKTI